VKVHCSRRPPETTIVDGIRVTTVARTLLDLATTVGPQELRLAVEAAERREVFDLRAIDALAAHGHHGLGKLRNAIEAAGGGAPWTRSGFENDFLAFLRARGFPEPQVNVLVCGELADFWWPEARLVVETDSWPFHRGRRRFREDRRRDAVLTVNGIRSVRVTDDQFRDEPHAVEAILRALL
jgi:very-short-patch-repair endonuclease